MNTKIKKSKSEESFCRKKGIKEEMCFLGACTVKGLQSSKPKVHLRGSYSL